jgi:uncharacterized zinc-type alcohol dehydrogenase-like protein
MTVQAYAAHEAGGKLEPFEYELGSLKPDEVEIDVEYCGICHSDLSMLKNEWGFTRYPFVPGHEVVGRVSAIGNMVNHLNVGQYVGLGWRARSCLVCDQCLSGHHNRCLKGEDVIVHRHGAYADKVRCLPASECLSARRHNGSPAQWLNVFLVGKVQDCLLPLHSSANWSSYFFVSAVS